MEGILVMSGSYAQINKTIKEINEMVDQYQLILPRGLCHLSNVTGRLTEEMVTEISHKIEILNDGISKCDKTLGELEIVTLPSSELTKARKKWENIKYVLFQLRERMEFVRNRELELLKQE